MHPTPVVLPGESHGQRSLAGYRPWRLKESGTTEHVHLSMWARVKEREVGIETGRVRRTEINIERRLERQSERLIPESERSLENYERYD